MRSPTSFIRNSAASTPVPDDAGYQLSLKLRGSYPTFAAGLEALVQLSNLLSVLGWNAEATLLAPDGSDACGRPLLIRAVNGNLTMS